MKTITMKKIVLTMTSFFLFTSIFGQEQQSKDIQSLKSHKNAEHVKSIEDSKQISTTTSSSNQPVSYAIGRDGIQRIVKEEKKLADFSSETIQTVTIQLKELFGDYYAEQGEPNIPFYADFYERCEFIPFNAAPSGVKNISSLNVKDKYNPEIIFHDNLQEFNADTFNILKYSFDYYNGADEYYKIYDTDTVVRIKGFK